MQDIIWPPRFIAINLPTIVGVMEFKVKLYISITSMNLIEDESCLSVLKLKYPAIIIFFPFQSPLIASNKASSFEKICLALH